MILRSHFINYSIPFANQKVNKLTLSLTLITSFMKCVTGTFLKIKENLHHESFLKHLMH